MSYNLFGNLQMLNHPVNIPILKLFLNVIGIYMVIGVPIYTLGWKIDKRLATGCLLYVMKTYWPIRKESLLNFYAI